MPQIHPNQRVFLDQDSFATTLLLTVVDEYGLECLEWSPETVQLHIIEDFGVDIRQELLDRLFAAMLLTTSNFFYRSLPSFINICNVLSGTSYDPNVFDPADPYETAWGLTEASLIYPAGQEEVFDDQVTGYISESLAGIGLSNIPKIFLPYLQEGSLPKVNNDTFEEDASLLEAVYANQTSNANDIDLAVQRSLHKLIQQVDLLQLRNGQARDSVLKAIHDNDNDSENDNANK